MKINSIRQLFSLHCRASSCTKQRASSCTKRYDVLNHSCVPVMTNTKAIFVHVFVATQLLSAGCSFAMNEFDISKDSDSKTVVNTDDPTNATDSDSGSDTRFDTSLDINSDDEWLDSSDSNTESGVDTLPDSDTATGKNDSDNVTDFTTDSATDTNSEFDTETIPPKNETDPPSSTDSDTVVGPDTSSDFDTATGTEPTVSTDSQSDPYCDGCLIAGRCYKHGFLNPADDCQQCNIELSQDEWSDVICDDNIHCTFDRCEHGKCVYPVKPDVCLIGGECRLANTYNPNERCQFCSPDNSQLKWTNRPKNYSCDDGTYCNGQDDRCDGQGTCVHDGDPCAGKPVCNSTCNENKMNCISPTSLVCEQTVVSQCLESGCGGRVQSYERSTFCNGSSDVCNGISSLTEPVEFKCEVTEKCGSDSSGQIKCLPDPKCECLDMLGEYDEQSGLCWKNPPESQAEKWEQATETCSGYNFFSNDNVSGSAMEEMWHLPNIDELISLMRGCVDGTSTGDFSESLCEMVPDGCAFEDSAVCSSTSEDCATCANKANGCYWHTALSGDCGSYWSSTRFETGEYWSIDFSNGSVSVFDTKEPLNIRCVKYMNSTNYR